MQTFFEDYLHEYLDPNDSEESSDEGDFDWQGFEADFESDVTSRSEMSADCRPNEGNERMIDGEQEREDEQEYCQPGECYGKTQKKSEN